MQEGEFAALTQRQGGVFTRSQALTLGSRRELEINTRRGLWVPVFRGVLRVADRPESAELRADAAALYFGDRMGAVSHQTAGSLHGIGVVDEPKTHVIVPKTVQSVEPSITVHRGSVPTALHRTTAGTPFTSAARTAIDLVRCGERIDGLAVLDRTVRLHKMSGGRLGASVEQLWAEAALHAGRRGIATVVELLKLVDPGAASPMESRSRLRCLDAGLPRPVTQVLIVTKYGRRYGDLGWPQYKVAAEYDSLEHHSGIEKVRRDNTRHNELTASGWIVVYASPYQVYHRPEGFTVPIRNAILSRSGR